MLHEDETMDTRAKKVSQSFHLVKHILIAVLFNYMCITNLPLCSLLRDIHTNTQSTVMTGPAADSVF